MKRLPLFFRIICCLLLGVVVCLALIWVGLGRDATEKIGTALFMPCGFLWLMLLALTIQYWPFRNSADSPPRSLGVILCFAGYSIAGSGYVSEALANALEGPYLQIDPLKAPVPRLVIVLGGGGGLGANGRLQGNGSGDRMILAAQLYHRDSATRFICTGQRIESMNSSGVDPAETSRSILVGLGVPDSCIELTGGKNTSEEMRNLGARFEHSSEEIGLLTSAWHLPRATRLAVRNGLKTIPLPADFRSSPRGLPLTLGQRIEGLVPNGFAFGSNWSFAKEYVGMLVGR